MTCITCARCTLQRAHRGLRTEPGSSLSAGQGDTGTSYNQLIRPVMESYLSRNVQVMTPVQTDINKHHETLGDQPGVPVTTNSRH